MKLILNILAACFTLFGQVIPFEGTNWGIKYLNDHPSLIKPFPLSIGLIASFLFTLTITPISNARYGLTVDNGKGGAAINPFWAWLGLCLIITFGINMMLE